MIHQELFSNTHHIRNDSANLDSIKNNLQLDSSSDDSTFPSDSAKSDSESNPVSSRNMVPEIISSPNAEDIEEPKSKQVSSFNQNPETSTVINHNQIIA